MFPSFIRETFNLLTILGNMKDLTMSAIDRQNILNNEKAILNIQGYLGVTGMLFLSEQMLAFLFLYFHR